MQQEPPVPTTEKDRHANRKWYRMYLLLLFVLAALLMFFVWFTNYFS